MIIKICGMRNADNIKEVENLGADWMGFIFYHPSKRYIGKTPPAYLPQKTKRVGVFVDATSDEIIEAMYSFGLQIIQLHGNESPQFCTALKTILKAKNNTYNTPQIIKVFPISLEQKIAQKAIDRTNLYEGLCDYFLFDTACPDHGGSGKTFSWEILYKYQGNTPFILSGGIGMEHLTPLSTFQHPQFLGIDLNSRFEKEPAYKDIKALETFIHHIKK